MKFGEHSRLGESISWRCWQTVIEVVSTASSLVESYMVSSCRAVISSRKDASRRIEKDSKPALEGMYHSRAYRPGGSGGVGRDETVSALGDEACIWVGGPASRGGKRAKTGDTASPVSQVPVESAPDEVVSCRHHLEFRGCQGAGFQRDEKTLDVLCHNFRLLVLGLHSLQHATR